jgi:hypothetical protein
MKFFSKKLSWKLVVLVLFCGVTLILWAGYTKAHSPSDGEWFREMQRGWEEECKRGGLVKVGKDTWGHPVDLTRHIVGECEHREAEIQCRIMKGDLPARVDMAFGLAYKQSTDDAYIKTSPGNDPVVLDAWDRPLNIVLRSELLQDKAVSDSLRAKTNVVIIWSSGRDGTNEYGGGDDVVLKEASCRRRADYDCKE